LCGCFRSFQSSCKTARILDYFIFHRFHSFSIDVLGKALELSNEIFSGAIEQLEKREIVRQAKKIKNPNNMSTILLIHYALDL
jgi:hypothetical protein